MKKLAAYNNAEITVDRADGELVKVTIQQGGDHMFLSTGVLVDPNQARRLATIIEHVAQQVLRTTDGERQ